MGLKQNMEALKKKLKNSKYIFNHLFLKIKILYHLLRVIYKYFKNDRLSNEKKSYETAK